MAAAGGAKRSCEAGGASNDNDPSNWSTRSHFPCSLPDGYVGGLRWNLQSDFETCGRPNVRPTHSSENADPLSFGVREVGLVVCDITAIHMFKITATCCVRFLCLQVPDSSSYVGGGL